MVNLDRQSFISLLTAYEKERDMLNDISSFIESFADSYVVLNETPANAAILKHLEEMMEDKDEWISWYLFEKNDAPAEIDGLKVYVEDKDDLYDLLTIALSTDEDIAYYIASILYDNEEYKSRFRPEAVRKSMDMYMYICSNIDETISKFESPKTKKEENMLSYLKILKKEIGEDVPSPLERENVGREEIRQYMERKLKESGCQKIEEITDEMINKVIEKVLLGSSIKDAADSMFGDCR